MANPAMEVNETEEIDYLNNPGVHQLRETPHDQLSLGDQVFVTDGIDGSDWSLDEGNGVSGKVTSWTGYARPSVVTGGDGGGS